MPNPIFTLQSQSGVRRDGTELHSPFYNDAVWTRFQRGQPRKIGGYSQLSGQLNAPIRSVFVSGTNGETLGHYFGQWGIQRQVISGISATGLIDRTPVGFVPDARLHWSHSLMYSSTGGSYMALLAASTPDVLSTTSDEGGSLYAGNIAGTEPLTLVSDGSGPISVSGGICVLQPFAVAYGSNGLLYNSNINDFSTATGWTIGGSNKANKANVAGTKIVYGAPVRGGGQSPAGLFWALDSLIRMSFVGGTAIWSYDTLSNPTSILGKKTIVEHDGKFFWIGTDRFLFYNGTVQELPNQMNCNYFFEGLNYEHRNKVWGTKISRFGEIWWFYPRGSDTECNHAIIFNYNENTWYDAKSSRSAGHSVQLYPKPVWAGTEDAQSTVALPIGFTLSTSVVGANNSPLLPFTSTSGVAIGMRVTGVDTHLPSSATVTAFTGTQVTLSANSVGIVPAGAAVVFTAMPSPFVAGQIITGSTSGATGTVARVTSTAINVTNVTGTFINGEGLTGNTGAAATVIAVPYAQTLASVYRHETGWDKIVAQSIYAIEAGFTTCNFGLAIGGPFGDAAQTVDILTRVTKIEPDFDNTGDIELSILGKSYAKQPYAVLDSKTVSPNTPFVSFRAQERIIKMQLTSHTLGGFFEGGQTLVHLEPGDERGGSS